MIENCSEIYGFLGKYGLNCDHVDAAILQNEYPGDGLVLRDWAITQDFYNFQITIDVGILVLKTNRVVDISARRCIRDDETVSFWVLLISTEPGGIGPVERFESEAYQTLQL